MKDRREPQPLALDPSRRRQACRGRPCAAPAALLLVLAAACQPPPPQLIKAGEVTLQLAPGDEARRDCPSAPAGVRPPTLACLYGPPAEALAPYAAQLREQGWTSRDDQTWQGPQTAEGAHPCLVVRAFQSNFRRRERTVIEFEWVDPAIGCPAGGTTHA